MKILLTGATGYVGRRLLPLLIEQGHEVVCLVRDPQRLDFDLSPFPEASVVQADLLAPASLAALPTDIDAAYYLVHSMSSGKGDFSSREEESAAHFVQYLDQTQARQVIYLGGIANDVALSPHLSSRKRVEDILATGRVPLTVLRAAIIIGSGSASFEIIRDLVEKLPVMVAPRWLETRCQPIAIRNVLQYLTGVLGHPGTLGKTFDIGGVDVLSYKEVLLRFAEVRGYRRWIMTLPVLTPRLSSYWLYFVTSTTYELARHLVDSMGNEVVAQDAEIRALIPLDLLDFKTSVSLAFRKIEQSAVISSWTDALAHSKLDRRFLDQIRPPAYGVFKDVQTAHYDRPTAEVLDNLWRIGGERGWYAANWLWRLRGYLDKVAGGVGLRRGRRSATELFPGDALDFWRVILADRSRGRLLLYAEMKLPGEAWLEFEVEPEQGLIKQTATFRPRGVAGRIYWYLVLPFHGFIFPMMLKGVVDYRAPAPA